MKILDINFWDAERKLLFKILFPLIFDAAIAGAELGLDNLVELGIGVDWGLVNQDALDWAREYTYDLVKGINETSRKFTQTAVSGWIESGAPLKDLRAELEPMFGKVRAKMIASTETTRAFAVSKQTTWKASEVVEGYNIALTDMDACPKCVEIASGGPYDIDDTEHLPPFHVNCRCGIKPVVILGDEP